jgi:hypothetical protein
MRWSRGIHRCLVMAVPIRTDWNQWTAIGTLALAGVKLLTLQVTVALSLWERRHADRQIAAEHVAAATGGRDRPVRSGRIVRRSCCLHRSPGHQPCHRARQWLAGGADCFRRCRHSKRPCTYSFRLVHRDTGLHGPGASSARARQPGFRSLVAWCHLICACRGSSAVHGS